MTRDHIKAAVTDLKENNITIDEFMELVDTYLADNKIDESFNGGSRG